MECVPLRGQNIVFFYNVTFINKTPNFSPVNRRLDAGGQIGKKKFLNIYVFIGKIGIDAQICAQIHLVRVYEEKNETNDSVIRMKSITLQAVLIDTQ